MKKFLVILALFIAPACFAQSGSCTTATCTAAGLTSAQIVAALPSPSNSNPTVVVNLPSGTTALTAAITVTVPTAVTNLTIHGNTTVTCTGTAGTSNYTCSATDATTLQDGISANTFFFQFNTNGSNTFVRLTGVTLAGGSGGSSKYSGEIAVYGNSNGVRFDHNHFTNSGYPGAPASAIQNGYIRYFNNGTLQSVVDHNVFDANPNDASNSNWNMVQFGNAYNDTIGNADGTWANPTPWGTANGIYVESNQINGSYGNDCFNGGFGVIRYNTFSGANEPMQTHATKSDAGSPRGCRGEEFYNNYISNTLLTNAMVGGKGGPYIIVANTEPAGTSKYLLDVSTDRDTTTQGEVGPPSGWGYVGCAPSYVGTATATLSGSIFTFTGTGFSTSWTSGCNLLAAVDGGGTGLSGWATFTLNATATATSMTATCSQPSGGGGCPSSSPGSTTINMGSAWDGNHSSNGYPALDGLGRGQTVQALNGANLPSRLNNVTHTIAWPQQYLEPIYSCNNSVTGTLAQSLISDSITQLNVDVFMDNGSFTGTTGCGSGLAASRPATCTAGPGGTYYTSPTGSYGVGYYATDTKILYVCSSTNTWTQIWTPYTYPHPLTGGGSVTLSPSPENFGTVSTGSSSSPVTFTVTNNNATTATSISPSVSGGNSADFAITNTGAGSCSAAGGTLANGASCTFTIVFTPGAATVRSTTLSVSYSGGDGASPQTSALSGTGHASNPITGTQLNGNIKVNGNISIR